MKHEIRIHRAAAVELQEIYAWAAEFAPRTVERWYARLRKAVKTLELSPQRCPKSFESRRVQFDVREFLFGRKPHVIRLLFVIENEVVHVLSMRRGQRRYLTRKEVEDALSDSEQKRSDSDP